MGISALAAPPNDPRVGGQRYQAVLAVVKDDRTVTETPAAVGFCRQTLRHPAQLLPVVEVAVLDVRVGSVDARERSPCWLASRPSCGSRHPSPIRASI